MFCLQFREKKLVIYVIVGTFNVQGNCSQILPSFVGFEK